MSLDWYTCHEKNANVVILANSAGLTLFANAAMMSLDWHSCHEKNANDAILVNSAGLTLFACDLGEFRRTDFVRQYSNDVIGLVLVSLRLESCNLVD